MSAQLQTLGTVWHYVRFRGQSIASFLGTAEVTPVIQAEPAKLRVQNDIAGRTMGIQDVYDGERHVVNTVLNRFDYAVWKACRDSYYHLASITNHGVDDRYKRGSLLRGIGDFQLILVYDFTGVAPAHPLATADQPVGRMYYSAVLDGWGEDAGATKVQAMPCTFGCESVYDPSTRSFGLYTEVAANFGTLGTLS